MLPSLGENMFIELNVEEITAKLQQSRNPNSKDQHTKEEKLKMWDDLKTLSFTRTISAVYIVTLLSLFTFIQLNLLGRFIYLESVETFSQKGKYNDSNPRRKSTKGLSFDTERKYLTFSWFLLHTGWKTLTNRVSLAVKQNLEGFPLREGLSFEALAMLIGRIRDQVEKTDSAGTMINITEFLLPTENSEEEVLRKAGVLVGEHQNEAENFQQSQLVDSELRDLLNETRDLLESSDFQLVLKSCLDCAFSVALGQIRNGFSPGGLPSPFMQSQLNHEDPLVIKTLAELIPIVSKISFSVINGIPNEYVTILSLEHISTSRIESIFTMSQQGNWFFDKRDTQPPTGRRGVSTHRDPTPVTHSTYQYDPAPTIQPPATQQYTIIPVEPHIPNYLPVDLDSAKKHMKILGI
ncbi:peroxin [Nowakowskiella sp. JEL0078]|nr:peroxin [Nowakowskiella sp. JEL0078]